MTMLRRLSAFWKYMGVRANHNENFATYANYAAQQVNVSFLSLDEICERIGLLLAFS